MTHTVRNARAEAQAIIGRSFDPRVLEPSPPAVTEGPFFADDPAADGITRDGATLISPAPGERAIGWDQWLANHPDQADWAGERWLAGARRLPPLPREFVTARINMHRLASTVVAPVRFVANTKFGLRYTLGGFGTPFFGDDRQVRVANGLLIDQDGDTIRSAPITTLAAAAEFLGSEIDADTTTEDDSPPLGDIDEPLGITPVHTDFAGAWYGMAMAALERLRSSSVDPSRAQLWPGHFDLAAEAGTEDNRASYGASLGDAAIAEPYLYAALWYPDRANTDGVDLNAASFSGAVLRLSGFPADTDPTDVASDFWSDFHDGLHS